MTVRTRTGIRSLAPGELSDRMIKEYHEPRVQEVEGNTKELIDKIAEILSDHHTRYFEIKLESEGTLYYKGKMVCRY